VPPRCPATAGTRRNNRRNKISKVFRARSPPPPRAHATPPRSTRAHGLASAAATDHRSPDATRARVTPSAPLLKNDSPRRDVEERPAGASRPTGEGARSARGVGVQGLHPSPSPQPQKSKNPPPIGGGWPFWRCFGVKRKISKRALQKTGWRKLPNNGRAQVINVMRQGQTRAW